MPESNGPTRREFDRLQAQVDAIMRGGTTHGAILDERVREVRDALNGQGASLRSAIKDLEVRVDKDLTVLEATVDARLRSWTRFGWTLLGFLIVALLGIITTLITQSS